MSLNEIIKKIVKDFDKNPISRDELRKITDQMEGGHKFVKNLVHDKHKFERLKSSALFDGNLDDDKRGWLSSHNFKITLEILNRDLLPGRKVYVPNAGESPLLVYHALSPELENFVSLIVWLQSESSKQAWNFIADLIEQEDETKVLQFSEKCGIDLPNKIHPGSDRNSQLVQREHYESLYDWKFAYYIFDDGFTIMSRNSPINYRRLVLDETTHEEAFVGIRTTIGRLSEIKRKSIKVWTPCMNTKPRNWEWDLPEKFDKSKLKVNQLYFFQIFKKTGEDGIEVFVKRMEEADPIDIFGMLLSQSLYLLYLGKLRLKLVNKKQFEKLFNLFYEQTKSFCYRNKSELEIMENVNREFVQRVFTNDFTKWIDDELYFYPPLLRRHLSKSSLDHKEIIIKQFDESLKSQSHICFEEIPYDKNDNKLFYKQADKARINKMYDFVHFLLRSKRLILGIDQDIEEKHKRDIQIEWLKNKINSN